MFRAKMRLVARRTMCRAQPRARFGGSAGKLNRFVHRSHRRWRARFWTDFPKIPCFQGDSPPENSATSKLARRVGVKRVAHVDLSLTLTRLDRQGNLRTTPTDH
jgi:hypothetical protein